MDKEDIPFLSVAELARLIQGKEVSPVEATKAYLDRIDALDFKFNAYLTVCHREALRAAGEAERAVAQGNYLGPMHGIPVAVKDQLWTKGVRTTCGSRFLADFIPNEDATVVSNLRNTGAVILGKTNLSEFTTSVSHRYRTPRNPWDLDMLTGVSSSVSGAATSAFLCATSLGEDTSGSIRLPAAWCGVVGLMPTWGRVSRYGLIPGSWNKDAVGPISRTVEDAAITLSAIAGHDPRDPYSWRIPVPDYRQALDKDIRRIRVGIISEDFNSPAVEPEVREAVAMACSVLEDLGASLEEVSIPLAGYAEVIARAFWFVELAPAYQDWIKNRLHEYSPDNRVGLLRGSIMPAQAYYKAQKLRSLLRQQVHDALEAYDVLLSSTSGKPAQRAEDETSTVTSKEDAFTLPYIFASIYNLASAPALTLPCGLTSQTLPIGLQIGGRHGDEATLLKVAHAYEQHTTWHTLRPTAS